MKYQVQFFWEGGWSDFGSPAIEGFALRLRLFQLEAFSAELNKNVRVIPVASTTYAAR